MTQHRRHVTTPTARGGDSKPDLVRMTLEVSMSGPSSGH